MVRALGEKPASIGELPGRHMQIHRKLLADGAAPKGCGYVKISPLFDSRGRSENATYAYYPCDTVPIHEMISYQLKVPILVINETGMKLSRYWDAYTAADPRLGPRGDIGPYRYWKKWYHPIEKVWIASPHLSYGGRKTYTIAGDINSTLEMEGNRQIQRILHTWKYDHPDGWYTFSSGMGIVSDEYMTNFQRILDRVLTVVNEALGGEYIAYSNEFPAHSVRPRQRQCAASANGKKLFLGEKVTGNFSEEYNYCVDSVNLPTPGLPDQASRIMNGILMSTDLSHAVHDLEKSWIQLGRPDTSGFSMLSLAAMFGQEKILEYIWRETIIG
jgi:hypothetical protein